MDAGLHRLGDHTGVAEHGRRLFLVLPSQTPEQTQARNYALGGVIFGESIAIYMGLVFALNKIRIDVGRDGIDVTCGPLFFPLARSIARDDIAGVERITYSYRGPTVHRIVAKRTSGGDVIVVDRIAAQAAADALVAEVRRRMGIASG